MKNQDLILSLADDALILGQRWCEHLGTAPALELEIAGANIGLDLLGQAQLLYTLYADREGMGRTADDLAYKRDVMAFRNHLLVEQPNRDFGVVIARQFLFSVWQRCMLESLVTGHDAELAEIAAKALKEVRYHERFASEWMIRLGAGTSEANARMASALDYLWRYTGELFDDAPELFEAWEAVVDHVLAEAHLEKPKALRMLNGGLKGHHTEHLGHMLSSLQFLQRAYPGAQW